ncbi:hypothetical protein C5167_001216 [Papaver somniferum]|uniref:Uncharacterized protein n=1 Tax=Papaver somniferum TaxID=3469 RepID=A0A4Y7KW44_PAPSO|nr:hypothetical protein C5167_001216 [Papaver somniferum]
MARVRSPCFQIIKLQPSQKSFATERESTKRFHKKEIRYPLVFQTVRPPSMKLKKLLGPESPAPGVTRY